MHLMYTLDESGNRIYTLKVFLIVLDVSTQKFLIISQKSTDLGKITKSAHPGTILVFDSALLIAPRLSTQLVSLPMTNFHDTVSR